MSHCCGGCGGEDPLMKKTNTDKQGTEKSETSNNKGAEGNSSNKAESDAGSTTGTWQPSGQ